MQRVGVALQDVFIKQLQATQQWSFITNRYHTLQRSMFNRAQTFKQTTIADHQRGAALLDDVLQQPALVGDVDGHIHGAEFVQRQP